MCKHVSFVENILLKIKTIEKLETMAITQVNIKVQLVVHAI